MQRRTFLAQSGLSIGVGAFLPLGCQPPGARHRDEVDSPASTETWDDVRAQFRLTPDLIHMSLMLLASHPRPVREAIERHRTALDLDPCTYEEENYFAFEEEVRASAARYMGTQPGEVALTDSTTMGLGILYHGFRFRPGDEVLTTTHDHYSTFKSLDFGTAKAGATVRRIALYEDPFMANAEAMVGALRSAIGPATRLVAITHVHSSTGVKLPVREIADMIAEVNGTRNPEARIYLSVDGVHGFGIEDETMSSLGCDFFSAGTHKWMFGPRGTGVLFARRDAWDMVAPIIPSFEDPPYGEWMGLGAPDAYTFADLCTPGGFHSFEHRWALNAAFDFMLQIGKPRTAARTHALNTQLKEGLFDMKHVKLITPMDPKLSSGITCFMVEGMKPDEVVHALRKRNIIATASPYRISYARLTPSILNTEEEVVACIRAVEELG